jgi:hypothetical protein
MRAARWGGGIRMDRAFLFCDGLRSTILFQWQSHNLLLRDITDLLLLLPSFSKHDRIFLNACCRCGEQP